MENDKEKHDDLKRRIISRISFLISNESAMDEKPSNVDQLLRGKVNATLRDLPEFDTFKLDINETSSSSSYARLLIKLFEQIGSLYQFDDAISVSDLAVLLKAVDYVIAICVRPFLSTKVGRKHVENKSMHIFSECDVKMYESELLMSAVDFINKLLTWDFFKHHALSKHLYYFLAISVHVATDKSKVGTDLADRYRTLLHFLLDTVYKPFLFREFLVLIKVTVDPAQTSYCAQNLSYILISSDQSLIHFLKTCLDMLVNFDDWKCCQFFTKLILTVPKSMARKKDDYYSQISLQISKACKHYVFDSKDQTYAPKLQNFFICLWRCLHEKFRDLFEKFLFKELELPLIQCSLAMEHLPDERALTQSIEIMHYLYCNGPPDTNEYHRSLLKFLPMFVQMNHELHNSVSFCKNKVLALLQTTLKCCSDEDFVLILSDWIREPTVISYCTSSSGGIEVRRSCEMGDFPDNPMESEVCTEKWHYFQKVEAVIRALSCLPENEEKRLQCAYTLHCLKGLIAFNSTLPGWFRSSDQQFDDKRNVAEGTNPDSRTDRQFLDNVHEYLANFNFLKISVKQCDDFDAWNSEKIIELCVAILGDNCKDETTFVQDLRDMTVATCLAILAVLIRRPEVQQLVASRGLIEKLGRSLFSVSEYATDQEVRQAAMNIRSTLPIVDVACDNKVRQEAEDGHENIEKKSHSRKIQFDFEEALKDARDELIPVKAHGLIALTNLIRSRDKQAIEQLDILVEIFCDAMQNEDSYVFLPALNALSVAGELKTEFMLNFLLKKFIEAPDLYKNLSDQNRLKIGEAVVKISKILGDLGPYYADKIVNTFLLITKQSNEETVRACCLSNVGEMCKLMSYKLTSCIYELFSIVSRLLKHEQSEIVRRSCVNLVRNMLEVGDRQEMIQILGGKLLNIYRLLKDLYQNDKDHVVRLHAQVCIEILQERMKEALSANEFRVKKLNV